MSTYGITCGIATYTSFVVQNSNGNFVIISENPGRGYLGENAVVGEVEPNDGKGLEKLLRKNPHIKNILVMHEFGINPNDRFIPMVKHLSMMGIDIYVCPHSVHYEKYDTEYGTLWGLNKPAFEMYQGTASYVKGYILLTNGAYNASVKALPLHADKFTAIRHGVHDYSNLFDKGQARKLYFKYLRTLAGSDRLVRKFDSMASSVMNGNGKLIGASGLINGPKTENIPVARKEIEEKTGLPIYGIYVGVIHPKAAGHPDAIAAREYLIKCAEDDDKFIFINHFTSHSMFPISLASLDLCINYEEGNTQSGRLAHVLGIPNASWLVYYGEGNKEVSDMTCMPAARNKSEISEVGSRILMLARDEPTLASCIELAREHYAKLYGFQSQAEKYFECVSDSGGDFDVDSPRRFRNSLELILNRSISVQVA